MAIINFGGVKERVVTRKEFSLEKAHRVLKNEAIAIIGYGVQGPAQALNLKDNGFKVIIGQSPKFKRDWNRALADGWVTGKTLFDIDEAAERGTVIQFLVSDAAQREIWPQIKKHLKKGDALYFSHGFSITYQKQTKVIPPPDVDVILVAPKGSGTSVRRRSSGAGVSSAIRSSPSGASPPPWLSWRGSPWPVSDRAPCRPRPRRRWRRRRRRAFRPPTGRRRLPPFDEQVLHDEPAFASLVPDETTLKPEEISMRADTRFSPSFRQRP